MNYIKHLSGFFDKVSSDNRLNPTHISLYVSLFQFWNACRFHNPISISRNEVMKVSKICSKATYHKCIRELNDYGYLQYMPSYNPFKGSLVYLFNFQTSPKQALNGERTKIETSTEQALVPYINNTNNNKQQTKVNKRELPLKNKKSSSLKIGTNKKRKKVAAKKESPPLKGLAEGRGMIVPTITEVQEYFASQKFPEQEANKFFHHFTSNGWKVAGKTQMKDWHSASQKWMINCKTFNPSKTKSNATTGKNYSEAL